MVKERRKIEEVGQLDSISYESEEVGCKQRSFKLVKIYRLKRGKIEEVGQLEEIHTGMYFEVYTQLYILQFNHAYRTFVQDHHFRLSTVFLAEII